MGSTPLEPYFVSASNPIFWYTGFLDSIVNIDGYDRWVGERYDGQVIQGLSEKWGNVFPRTGININADHYKSSAVIAQRAIDYVFNGGSLIYSKNFGGDEKEWYVPASDTDESSNDLGKWQMLSPKKDDKCHMLGEIKSKNNNSTPEDDGWSDRRSEDGAYSWNYWRKYECCQQPSGYTFLFKVVVE
jgi:integrating conjugative element protein (TIGR03756 family)